MVARGEAMGQMTNVMEEELANREDITVRILGRPGVPPIDSERY